MKKIIALWIGLTFCFSAAIASASLTVPFSGTYFSGDGIDGFGEWVSDVRFSWDADNNNDGTWTYTYEWSAPSRDLSHIDIEVSPNFSDANLWSWSVNPSNNESYDIGYFDGNVWKAFKFDNLGESTSYTLTLTVNRIPMDGNFYAKDGTETYAHNSENFYIAVPNSVVPIPSALWLFVSGLIGVVGIRRKFRN